MANEIFQAVVSVAGQQATLKCGHTRFLINPKAKQARCLPCEAWHSDPKPKADPKPTPAPKATPKVAPRPIPPAPRQAPQAVEGERIRLATTTGVEIEMWVTPETLRRFEQQYGQRKHFQVAS